MTEDNQHPTPLSVTIDAIDALDALDALDAIDAIDAIDALDVHHIFFFKFSSIWELKTRLKA